MSGDTDALGDAEARYHQVAAELTRGLEEHVRGWIRRAVTERIPQDWSRERREAFAPRVDAVADQVHADVLPRLERLLALDVDEQRAGPLGVLRASVGSANQLLADSGVTPPRRDPVTASMFPDDPYDLGPANFDDVDPQLHEIGMIWGAAKAHVVLIRHRR